jgi:hypothetical protein
MHEESFKLHGSHRPAAVAAFGARQPFAETFLVAPQLIQNNSRG